MTQKPTLTKMLFHYVPFGAAVGCSPGIIVYFCDFSHWKKSCTKNKVNVTTINLNKKSSTE